MAEKEKPKKEDKPLVPKEDLEEGKDEIDLEIEKEIEEETPEPEPEEKEDAGPEGSIEVDGKLYKEDPDKPGEPLLEKGEKILFEEKKEPEKPEGAIEVDGVLYKEDPEKPEEALVGEDGELVLFEKPKRTPRTVPLYKLKIAEKNWLKDKGKLQETIDELNKKLQGRPDLSRDAKIEEFAKEHKMDSTVLKGLIKLVTPEGMIISDEMKNDIVKLKKELTWRKEFEQFDKDFLKNVSPLLKEGKISVEDQGKIKELLKAKAFTTDYANTPLAVIYRGDTDFDSFRGAPTKKKTVEPGGKGPRGGKPGDTKAIIAKEGEEEMTDKEFDEFDKGLEKEGKKKKLTIRRGGEEVEV